MAENSEATDMGKAYSAEIQQLTPTMRWAAEQDVALLQRVVQLYSDRGLLAVGSGGSFTAAAFAAELHLRTYGRPSQALTPLETYALPPSSTGHSLGFLLSAEGKNSDILAATRQLQLKGCPAIGLTLRRDSPLVRLCEQSGAATIAAFEMPWEKDGYLATNSLIATLILLWRAYATETDFRSVFADLLAWYEGFPKRLASAARGVDRAGRVLILHGVEGRTGAIDLESKLTEGALAFGQICNYRQFAHGRHLQLQQPEERITVVSLHAPNDALAQATQALLPESVGKFLEVTLLSRHYAATEIAAVLAAILITELWAGTERDPGRPDVPQFGRDLHSLDVANLVHESAGVSRAMQRKRGRDESIEQTFAQGQRYIARLGAARAKALVCDFDGTFCDTAKRFGGLDPQIAPEVTRLARSGIHIAFATGRGAKLAQELRSKLPQDIWPRVTVGCYSGSHIFSLDDSTAAKPDADSRLLELSRWLISSRALPEGVDPTADVSQLSVRGVSSAMKVQLISAIHEWIAQEGHRGWRVFCSAHSVDVLTEYAGKSRVVEYVSKVFELDADTQLLRFGDAGDFGGNDYELLASGLALSVDTVPPGADQCWNLLPREQAGVRGTHHYLRALSVSDGEARFSQEFIDQAVATLREGLELT